VLLVALKLGAGLIIHPYSCWKKSLIFAPKTKGMRNISKFPFSFKCFVAVSAFFLLSLKSIAQQINYKLSMPNPKSHYYHVEIELVNFKEKQIKVKLPVWAPGSYMVRDFSKHVDLVKARNENGSALKVQKSDKNTWVIDRDKATRVIVNYEVYAFDLTVRTSFLDHTHGYVNGTSVFMYVDGYKHLNGRLDVFPHPSFRDVSTSLKPAVEAMAADGVFSFRFDDYDQLVDCPMEIGNHEKFDFMAAGIKHRVVIYGEGNQDVERLKTDMAKICDLATAVFGSNPNDDYLFIIHNTELGGGGLEHMNSTTLNVRRFSYDGARYLDFLSLVAHEYFHLWNVKRLRPIELGPFDYDKENYTSLLWVMEGFTSYYDELLLRRANFYTKDQYLRALFSTINSVENQPGNKIQPVAHASFDAWIKLYHPNENSYNSTISYYSKGHLIGAVIDAMIISATRGKKGLDDFLRFLYEKYYLNAKRGFREEEFKKDLEGFIGQNLDSFFQDFIHGTKPLEYEKVFAAIGVNVIKTEKTEAFFGASISEVNGKLKVTRVQTNSAAEMAGISAKDEIIAINGFRTDLSGFNELIGRLRVGEPFDIMISRDGKIMNLKAVMGEVTKINYTYQLDSDPQKAALADFWLRVQN
jgi:predicted metalloprotease with PDZ domain